MTAELGGCREASGRTIEGDRRGGKKKEKAKRWGRKRDEEGRVGEGGAGQRLGGCRRRPRAREVAMSREVGGRGKEKKRKGMERERRGRGRRVEGEKKWRPAAWRVVKPQLQPRFLQLVTSLDSS